MSGLTLTSPRPDQPRSHHHLALIALPFLLLVSGLYYAHLLVGGVERPSGTWLGGWATASAAWRQTLAPDVADKEPAGRALHVAVEEFAGYHDEVYAGFLYTLSTLAPKVRTTFFRRGGQMHWGMQSIVSTYFSFPTQDWDTLLSRLSVDGDDDEPERIDVVLSTTCQVMMGQHNDDMLQVWRKRTHKYRLLCTLHHADRLEMSDEQLRPWAQAGALAVVGLSEHVRNNIRWRLDWLATKPHGSPAPFDSVPVYTFPPIFPYDFSLPSSSEPQPIAGVRPRVQRAVIQGSITQGRRDYNLVFDELKKAIREEPELWGWVARDDGVEEPWTRIESVQDPFELSLLGNVEEKLVPSELSDVVTVYSGEDYPVFYKRLHNHDLLLPAFGHQGYLVDSAVHTFAPSSPKCSDRRLQSSSIPAALIGHVPILATAMYLREYTYLSPHSVILRPATITSIEAIARLRRSNSTLGSVKTRLDDQPFQVRSWPRSEEELAAAREAVYQRNRETMLDMLFSSLSTLE